MADLRIAMLLVSHNRRELTLRALASITAPTGVDVTSVLFDDASTDGTVEAVLDRFPRTIVVRGDGSAFWNGGLHRAWRRALELNPDAFLWLNDDVQLDPLAIETMTTSWKSLTGREQDAIILVGATRGRDGRVTYSGMRQECSPFALRLLQVEPSDSAQRVDTFNGNIVLISKAVVEKIGINDPTYFHKFGDIDYGLRASRRGVPVYLLPATLGVCEANQPADIAQLSLLRRIKYANSHRGLPFAGWWRLTRRYSGKWFPLHFLLAYRWLITRPRHAPARSWE